MIKIAQNLKFRASANPKCRIRWTYNADKDLGVIVSVFALPVSMNRQRTWLSSLAETLIVLLCLCAIIMTARADEEYISASVGYDSQNRPTFRVPRKYEPKVYDNFFRIIVDYPSMRPTIGSRGSPINRDSLDIVVMGYPKNGTLGDDIVKGILGSKLIGKKGGYEIYSNPLGKAGPAKALVFRDAIGNYAAVELLGTWSVRNQITHGIAPHYLVRFSVDKHLGESFRDTDDSVMTLIGEMYVNGNK